MNGRGWMARHGFWPLALLWLPAGVVAQAALRVACPGLRAGGPSAGAFADAGEAMTALVSLAVTVPCGLPLALGCRRLWRLGYRRGAWLAGIALGVLIVLATVVAGLRCGSSGYGSRGTADRGRRWAGCGAWRPRARPR